MAEQLTTESKRPSPVLAAAWVYHTRQHGWQGTIAAPSGTPRSAERRTRARPRRRCDLGGSSVRSPPRVRIRPRSARAARGAHAIDRATRQHGRRRGEPRGAARAARVGLGRARRAQRDRRGGRLLRADRDCVRAGRAASPACLARRVRRTANRAGRFTRRGGRRGRGERVPGFGGRPGAGVPARWAGARSGRGRRVGLRRGGAGGARGRHAVRARSRPPAGALRARAGVGRCQADGRPRRTACRHRRRRDLPHPPGTRRTNPARRPEGPAPPRRSRPAPPGRTAGGTSGNPAAAAA